MKTRELARAANLTLRPFIGPSQTAALSELCRGEERQHFFDKLCDLAALVEGMAKTYEQEGKGEQAIASLHYFTSGADWYITERDTDTDGEGQQQAFGLADLFGDGGELGYINLAEILENGGELDLHFAPVTLEVLREQREHRAAAPRGWGEA